jgi:hypothetical protein
MWETAIHEAMLADQAYEAVRQLAQSMRRKDYPAPIQHEILGKLAGLMEHLPEALEQTTRALARSLDRYDIYDRDGNDPAVAVMGVQDHLRAVREPAVIVAAEIRAAQALIATQGHRD